MPTVTFKYRWGKDVVVEVNEECKIWEEPRYDGDKGRWRTLGYWRRHDYHSYRDGAVAVIVSPGVTTIGYRAFNKCTSLASVSLPPGVKTIEAEAFEQCRSLREVNVPAEVTTIGKAAFYDCRELQSMTLSAGVTTIGPYAFNGCEALRSFTVPNVRVIESNTFNDCSSLTSVTLPAGVKTIGVSAFSACTSLASITLSEGLTNIKKNAFGHCTSLRSITFPESLQEIESNAFKSCSSLIRVDVKSRHVRIDSKAFRNCPSIRFVNIHDSVVVLFRDSDWDMDADIFKSATLRQNYDDGRPAWRHLFAHVPQENVKWSGSFIQRYLGGYADRPSTLATVRSLRRAQNAPDKPHDRSLPRLPAEMVMGILDRI